MKQLDRFTYAVQVRRVIDGDTLELTEHGIDLGFGCKLFCSKGKDAKGNPLFYSIRVLAVQCPETRRGSWTQGLSEDQILKSLAAGQVAKEFTTIKVGTARRVFFRSAAAGPDNFGRLLGEVILEDAQGNLENLGELLLANKHAVLYKA